MVNYAYIDRNYYNNIINYMLIDDHLLTGVKDYLANLINKSFITEESDKVDENMRIFIKPKENYYKMKIFNNERIYIFHLSSEINNLYTIWFKEKVWMT